MKQRFLILILLLCLLCACQTQKKTQNGIPFSFYYPTAQPSGESTLLTDTVYYQEALPSEEELLRSYLSSTPPVGAARAIPSGWTVQSIARQDDGTLSIVFSGAEASAIERSVAAACLSRTFLQLDGILNVSLILPGVDKAINLTENDILFKDTAMLPQKEQIVLYYPDENLRYLVRETRTVEAMDATQKARYIVKTLLSNTASGKAHGCIPAGTSLVDANVENGICTVDLSSEFAQNMERSYTTERLAVYSIVNSLTELEEVRSVDFLVANAPLERLYLMDLSGSLERDERLLQSEGTDVTLYPFFDERDCLVPVALSIETGDKPLTPEQLLQALLSYEDDTGMSRCIPPDTKYLTVKIENGTCIIDLSAEFLDGCSDGREEMLAVRSIIATVCELQSVSSAEILVEGIPPTFNSALARVRVPNKTWFSE